MRHCAFTNQATRNSSESPEMGVKLLHILNPKMLVKINLLPISLYCQLPDLFQLLKIYNEDKSKPVLWDSSYKKGNGLQIRCAKKTERKKSRIEIGFRTCRVANHLPSYVTLFEPVGLQKRTAFFWQFKRSKKRRQLVHVAVSLRLPNLPKILEAIKRIGRDQHRRF